MIVRAAALLILPEPAICVEAFDRPGIGITVVEVADFLSHIRYYRKVFCLMDQSTLPTIPMHLLGAVSPAERLSAGETSSEALNCRR